MRARGGSGVASLSDGAVEIEVATDGPGLYEITDRIAALDGLDAAGAGLLTLFLRHTSASLLIQENADPDVRRDLAAFLSRLAPPADDPAMDWITHRAEGPDDMPAHIRAAVLPVCLQIPVIDGRLGLGTWQGVFVVEHRDRPHRRRLLAHLR